MCNQGQDGKPASIVCVSCTAANNMVASSNWTNKIDYQVRCLNAYILRLQQISGYSSW